MNIKIAETLANDLIRKHLDPSWSFAWSNSLSVFGRCCHSSRQIQLSINRTKDEQEFHVRDTILHEIAHALTPGEGHNIIWKRQAMILGATPRASAKSSAPYENLSKVSHVMVFGEKIVKKYFRKPNASTFAKLGTIYLRGRKQETKGKLEIMTVNKYMRLYPKAEVVMR